MEQTPEHIDRIFRNRLQDATTPPPAFVWDNIEVKLRKRRKRFLFWIFSLGLAATGVLGIWLSGTGGHHARLSDIQAPGDLNYNLGPADSKRAKSISYSTLSTEGESPAISSEPAKVVLTKAIHETTTSKLNGMSSLKNLPEQNVRSVERSAPAPVAAIENENLENLDPLSASEPSMVITRVETMTLLPTEMPTPVSRGNLSATNVSARKFQLKPTPIHSAKSKGKRAVKNCYDFARQPNAWMADVYVGPSLAQRELVSNTLDDKPYLNKRLSTERRDLAFNAGLRVSLMLKGNFLIRTGLHYDQMTERFEYIDPKYVITHVANVYHSDTGLTTLDTIGVEYGENYQKTYNRFGMLDIPLAIGVELRKGRSGFNFNAGMSLNLLFWKRGAIISPETGAPVWFTPGRKGAYPVFRPNSGLSATASVQWFYHLKPRLRFFVEPSFKRMLRPVSLPNHPLEQRYGIGGVRLGLTKILN